MTALKRLLAAAKERATVAEQQHQSLPERMPVAFTFESDPARRRENLRILRAFMNAHQYSFVEMLGIGSQSYYSAIECGKAQLTDYEARKIESDLGIPRGWLDRNNGEAIFVSNDELWLVQELRRSPPEAASSLVAMMKNLRAQKVLSP